VVEQFKPSLRTAGVAARGRDIFRSRCAECHRLSREGSRLGPDWRRKNPRQGKLLSAILEPNLEIARGYATSVVETHGQDNLIGSSAMKMNNDHLAPTGDVEVVWPRRNIQSIQPQTWSLMPDGMDKGLPRRPWRICSNTSRARQSETERGTSCPQQRANPKLQNPMRSFAIVLRSENELGIWDLFGIWSLRFGI